MGFHELSRVLRNLNGIERSSEGLTWVYIFGLYKGYKEGVHGVWGSMASV